MPRMSATTPENIDKVAGIRNDLNAKRAAAIQKFMTTQFGPPITYEVLVHDAPTPGISAIFAGGPTAARAPATAAA